MNGAPLTAPEDQDAASVRVQVSYCHAERLAAACGRVGSEDSRDKPTARRVATQHRGRLAGVGVSLERIVAAKPSL
jgi:hypothetical protein